MKPLDPKVRAWLDEVNAGDLPPADAQGRVWNELGPRLGRPLPETATAAARALHASAKPAASGAAPLVLKLVVGATLGGAVVFATMQYASRVPAPETRAGGQLPGPVADASEGSRPAAATTPPDVSSAAAPRADARSRLSEESHILSQAQHALRAHAAQDALTWIEEHAAKFPHGVLVQEREAARVLALCQLERDADAHEAQADFLRSWPSSPLSDRVRNACSKP